MKDFIAKVFGYLILFGSVLLKAPQIYNIFATHTVEGLSPTALYIEVTTSMTSIVYNYKNNNPFSSYGEGATIMVQNFVIVILLWKLAKPSPPSSAFQLQMVAGFIVLSLLCYSIPMEFQYLLPLSTIPLLISSQLAQIISNFQAGSTGQLSSISTFLIFTGKVGLDLSLLSGFLLNALLTGVQLLQIVYYSYMVKSEKVQTN
eukprot:gene25190-33714_t